MKRLTDTEFDRSSVASFDTRSELINNVDFQNCYVELYKCLREYIWDFDTVCQIADLELACYKTFPSIQEIQSCLNRLRSSVYNVVSEDNDMKDAFDAFRDVLDHTDTYSDIYRVSEVIQK